jgi:hypothetical protein
MSDKAFLIIVGVSLAFILIYGIIRIICRAQGSWSVKLTPVAIAIKPERAGGFESKGELRARAFLEDYFKRPFNKARPDFLGNDVTGVKRNLELDCFNEGLGLAVEYNGRQHYEFVPYFHSSREAFYNQKYRDKLKKIYCTERGITLIEIPYTELKHLEVWLENSLRASGYQRVAAAPADL